MIHLKGFRPDYEDYILKSGVLEADELSHHPFLVLKELAGKNVQIELVKNVKLLLKYDNETKVIGQWPGKWRSDFFTFTVQELKNLLVKNSKEEFGIINS